MNPETTHSLQVYLQHPTVASAIDFLSHPNLRNELTPGQIESLNNQFKDNTNEDVFILLLNQMLLSIAQVCVQAKHFIQSKSTQKQVGIYLLNQNFKNDDILSWILQQDDQDQELLQISCRLSRKSISLKIQSELWEGLYLKSSACLKSNTAKNVPEHLQMLCHSIYASKKIVNQNVLFDLIRQVIHDQIENVHVCQNICLLYNTIIYCDPSITQQLVSNNILSLIISMVISHMKDSELMQQALKVILMLVSVRQCQYLLIDMEFMRICEQSTQYQNKKEVFELILQLVAHLKNEFNLQEKLVEQQVIRFLLRAVKQFDEDPRLTNSCIQLLGQFLVIREAVQQFYVNDAFNILNTVLKIYVFDFDLTLTILQTLNQCLSVDMDKVDLVLPSQINKQFLRLINELYKKANHRKSLSIIYELLTFLSILSTDSIKCHILWSSDCVERIFFFILESQFYNEGSLIEMLVNLLNVYSQLSTPQEFILRNARHLGTMINGHIRNLDICSDLIGILGRIIIGGQYEEEMFEIFIPLSLGMLEQHLEEESIAKRILDIYYQLSLVNFQCKVKLQEICLPVLNQLENNNHSLLHPYQQALSQLTKSKIATSQGLLSKEARDYLIKGIVCRLFKEDGSISELLVFVSSDLASIQCKREKERIIKSKWRMATKHIESIRDYANDYNAWQKSPFKNGGTLLSKKPDQELCLSIVGNQLINNHLRQIQFNICAPSIEDKKKLLDYLRLLIQIN